MEPKYPLGKVQFNISPKLENSGNSLQEREKEFVYKFFREKSTVIFKFVIDTKKDLEEVLEIYSKYHLKAEQIYLMPEGIDSNILKEKTKWLVEKCKKYNFNFTPRIQIDIWGNKRGI